MQKRHYEQLAFVLARCVNRVDNSFCMEFIQELRKHNKNMNVEMFIARVDGYIRERHSHSPS